MSAGQRTVLLAGATGLVGRECLALLLADPSVSRVVTLTRRPIPLDNPSDAKLDPHVTDFDGLSGYRTLPRVDQIVCALGTTIKQAGSRERFRRVDFGYPLAIARLGLEREAKHFLLVSALGANARSRVFYSRVKGELEDAILGLPYRSVTIVRPSLLMGERKEFRIGEEIAKRLAFLFPRKYAPVRARDVALALLAAAGADAPGRRVIESVEIRAGSA